MKKLFIAIISVLLCISFISCEVVFDVLNELEDGGNYDYVEKSTEETEDTGHLSVWYIDVGQGDSIFIESPEGMTMLIDCGEYEKIDCVRDFLDDKGIERIDCLVVTHPHTDHMGGMATIIRNYDIGSIYMPKVTSNTTAFEVMLKAIQEKSMKIKTAKAGMTIDFGSVDADIIAPISAEYEGLNNYSVVIRMQYKDRSFLFTGDIESEVEKELLDSKENLDSDVLKVAHHGSNSSSTTKFIEAVSPICSVICVGENNDYGHPKEKVLKRLSDTEILRTDEEGTIHIYTDGYGLFKETENNPKTVKLSLSRNSKDDDIVYLSSSGNKYHTNTCTYYKEEYKPVKRSSAEANGYTACTKCKP